MPQLVPPPPLSAEWGEDVWKQFFELLRKQVNQPPFYAQTTDPGTAGVPDGTWSVWLNTTSGVLTLWANQSGVLKSVVLT